MTEYIDRQALEVALNHRLAFLMAENSEYDHYTSGYDEATTTVENFPSTDAVPVVRCKDCKYGDYDSKSNGAMVCLRTNDGFWREETDFCSYGERRDGGNGDVSD